MSSAIDPTLPGGALVVSLDFELFWGMRDKLPLGRYRRNILGGRAAVPRMLDLFAEHGVHATWATVGAMLCEGPDELRAVLPARQPRYLDPRLALDRTLDALDRCAGDVACFFAPDLVRQVHQAPHQEIATHTLSHLNCLEPGPDAEDFRADLAAALDLHEERLGTRPSAIVFPRNQVAWLDVCADLGLTAYRAATPGRIYAPRADQDERPWRRALRLVDAYLPVAPDASWALDDIDSAAGIAEVPTSRFLRPYIRRLDRLEAVRLRRVDQELTRAAQTGRVFHLWWHPHNLGADVDRGLAMIRRVLDHHRRLRDRYGTVSLTMTEAATLARRRVASPAA